MKTKKKLCEIKNMDHFNRIYKLEQAVTIQHQYFIQQKCFL